jgi:hypothetical protein
MWQFTNRWLWAAMAGSVVLQVVVVYVPFLQDAFGTAVERPGLAGLCRHREFRVVATGSEQGDAGCGPSAAGPTPEALDRDKPAGPNGIRTRV